MKTIIILTGATGYVGQHILYSFLINGIPNTLNDINNDTTDSNDSTTTTTATATATATTSSSSVESVEYYIYALGGTKTDTNFKESVEKVVIDNNITDNKKNNIISVTIINNFDLSNNISIDTFFNTYFPTNIVSEVDSISISISTTATNVIQQCNCIIIHTAAISNPSKCQENCTKAFLINTAQYFFQSIYTRFNTNNSFHIVTTNDQIQLQQKLVQDNNSTTNNVVYYTPNNVCIIALSTDQVYDGTLQKDIPYYTEEQEQVQPCNVYGQSKYNMEQVLLQLSTQNQQLLSFEKQQQSQKQIKIILLRTSIIIGTKISPFILSHETFFHFIHSRIGITTTYYTNEYRSIVSLQNVLQTINYFIINNSSQQKQEDNNNNNKNYIIYNMGGYNSLSRYDMALAVVDYYVTVTNKTQNEKEQLLLHIIPQEKDDTSNSTSNTQVVHVPSPLNISMNSTKLYNTINFKYNTLNELVQLAFT